MLTTLASVLVALAASLLPMGLLIGWAIWKKRRHLRRSPLTTDLHHLPGQYLSSQVERLSEKASDRLMLAMLIGPIVLAAWAIERVDLRLVHFGWWEITLMLLVVIVTFLFGRSGIRILQIRRQYLEGLEAERATAQELTPLIAKGCTLYHDVPAGRFNLDHIVIGLSKVYMVETKSRLKPAGRGVSNVRVKFDGKTLVFPDWHDSKMLDQARGQARWLSDYLYRKTGEHVAVEPVLALPGWFVECTVQAADVHVINPKAHGFMASADGKLMPDAQRRRIMTAIEERYRVTDNSVEASKQYG